MEGFNGRVFKLRVGIPYNRYPDSSYSVRSNGLIIGSVYALNYTPGRLAASERADNATDKRIGLGKSPKGGYGFIGIFYLPFIAQ